MNTTYKSNVPMNFYGVYKNIKAAMEMRNGRFTVQKGSGIVRQLMPYVQYDERLASIPRRRLQYQNILIPYGNDYLLHDDVFFRTPSAAASFVTGGPSNGYDFWRAVGTHETLGAFRLGPTPTRNRAGLDEELEDTTSEQHDELMHRYGEAFSNENVRLLTAEVKAQWDKINAIPTGIASYIESNVSPRFDRLESSNNAMRAELVSLASKLDNLNTGGSNFVDTSAPVFLSEEDIENFRASLRNASQEIAALSGNLEKLVREGGDPASVIRYATDLERVVTPEVASICKQVRVHFNKTNELA